MSVLCRRSVPFVVFLLMVWLHLTGARTAGAAVKGYTFAPPSSWVERIAPPEVPSSAGEGAITDLLIDEQVRFARAPSSRRSTVAVALAEFGQVSGSDSCSR